MSSPTGGGTQINRDGALLGVEYIGVSPASAGAAQAAAAADHVHRVRSSSSEIFGFGRMLQLVFTQSVEGFLPTAALWSQSPVTVPPEWCAEFWLATFIGFSSPTNGGLAFIGWAQPNGTYPWGKDGAALPNQMGLNNPSGGGEASAYWGNNRQASLSSSTKSPSGTPMHMLVQMDSAGNMWAGVDGTLYGPFAPPAGSEIYTEAFPIVMLFDGIGGDYAQGPGAAFDEVRFSSTLRYPTAGGSYEVPSAPFNPDAQTIVLWHLDDVPYGPFFESSGTGSDDTWAPSNFLTEDSGPSGILGQFALAGGVSGRLADVTFEGVNSTVGPNSGSGAAAAVESIQGQTGNFLLVDGGGNPLGVSNPSGAQLITVVGELMDAVEFWL